MPDLCTLADLKAWLAITDTGSDALLARLITATSADFLNEIRRLDLTPEADWTDHLFSIRDYWWMGAIGWRSYWQAPEVSYGGRRNEIYLRHYPVNSITSVTLDGNALTAVTDPNDVTQSGFWFDSSLDAEQRQKISLVGLSGFGLQGWGNPLGNAIIIYKAGYMAVPAAISQAIIEWVSFKRGQSQLQQQDQSAGAVQIGDYAQTGSASELTLGVLEAEMPVNVQRVIDQYRRPVI